MLIERQLRRRRGILPRRRRAGRWPSLVNIRLVDAKVARPIDEGGITMPGIRACRAAMSGFTRVANLRALQFQAPVLPGGGVGAKACRTTPVPLATTLADSI